MDAINVEKALENWEQYKDWFGDRKKKIPGFS